MHITYVSSAMEANSFTALFKDSKKIPGQQAQKFNRLMIEGFGKSSASVTALSAIPVTPANCPQKYIPGQTIRSEQVTWRYPSTLNIRGIKNLWQMAAAFFNTLKLCARKDSAVVCDVLNASVSYGAVLAGRLLGRQCVGVVTDLPHLMVTGVNAKHTKLVNKIMELCTGYVLLTEAMNDEVNPKGKPYVIVEGLCDVGMQTAETKEKPENRFCMYAGLLDARYGAKMMVDGFLQADVSGAELHIYGGGPYVPELEQVVREHKNVIYHGTVMNEQIVAAELQASLLINPRPTHEEFTKYSFPSKNMEYMVSGTPVLTTKLPGMPEEYYPYVYLLEEETAEGMAAALKNLLTKPAEELAQKGADAKAFVMDKKNNIVQAQKIFDMIEKQSR